MSGDIMESPDPKRESPDETSTPSPQPDPADSPAGDGANTLLLEVVSLVAAANPGGDPPALLTLDLDAILEQFGAQLCKLNGGTWTKGRPATYRSLKERDLTIDIRRPGGATDDWLKGELAELSPSALTILLLPLDINRDLVKKIDPAAANRAVLAAELAAFLAMKPRDEKRSAAANQFSLGDHPISDATADQLGFAAYASAIANIIDNPETETPLTLAIHAPWGVGKSSLGRMIQQRLTEAPATGRKGTKAPPTSPHRVFWFNAWRHDEADTLVTAFLSELARDCFRNSPLLARAFLPLPAPMRTKAMSYWVRAVYFLSAIVIAALLYWLANKIGLVDLVTSFFGGEAPEPAKQAAGAPDTPEAVKAKTVVGGSILTVIGPMLRWAMSFRGSIEQFIDDPKAAAAKGLIGDIRSQMASLIRRSSPPGTRLVIFIDDIERCRGSGGIDLLEAINQLLMQTDDGRAVSPVVVVVLGDIDLVALAAGHKYQETAKASALVEAENSPSNGEKTDDADAIALFHYGRRHLQKIVQLRFNIPAPEVGLLEAMSRMLIRGSAAPKPESGKLDVPADTNSKPPQRDQSRARPRKLAALNPATAILAHRPLGQLWASASWFGRLVLILRLPAFLMASMSAGFAAQKVGRPQPFNYDPRKTSLAVWHLFLVGYAASYLIPILFCVTALRIVFWILPPDLRLDLASYRIFYDVAFPLGAPGLIDVRTPFIAMICVTVAAILFLRAGFMAIYTHLQELIGEEINATPDAERRKNPYMDAFEAEQLLQRVRENAARLALINDSDYFGTAHDKVVNLLRPTPRLLKRTSNKVRLLMAILNERKLLLDSATADDLPTGIAAGTLGKWVVFEERWPDVARLAMTEPELLTAIGSCDVSTWRTSKPIKDAAAINAFLSEKTTPISQVELKLLVTLCPPAPSERQAAHQPG